MLTKNVSMLYHHLAAINGHDEDIADGATFA